LPEYDPDHARIAARRHGFTLLFGSACLGFGLEAAHAFKLSSYLDVPLRRELLTLAHAHGVGLSLVLLAYAASGPGRARGSSTREQAQQQESAAQQRLLSFGCLLVPLGFALASIDLHESDPGVGIVLVPLGALAILRALYKLMRAAWR